MKNILLISCLKFVDKSAESYLRRVISLLLSFKYLPSVFSKKCLVNAPHAAGTMACSKVPF